jgi:hypothetical protein
MLIFNLQSKCEELVSLTPLQHSRPDTTEKLAGSPPLEGVMG